MNYDTIDYVVEDRILRLTLNRPDQMNAFTTQMGKELEHAFARASDDDEVAVIVVTGAGKAFCAGMDLSVDGNVFGLDESQRPTLADMAEPEAMDGVRDSGGAVTLAIHDCKKPVIAAINGAAVGIGATMTLAMDFRLASERARFGFVFTRLGIAPEACSSWFLPRLVGLQRAMEWVLTGEIFKADEALDGGLVRSVHAPEDLLDAAMELAHRIADHTSPVSVALARQMLLRNAAQPHPVEAHRVDSLAMFYTSIGDGKEGVQAFLEKRKPDYTSKPSGDMPPFYPWW